MWGGGRESSPCAVLDFQPEAASLRRPSEWCWGTITKVVHWKRLRVGKERDFPLMSPVVWEETLKCQVIRDSGHELLDSNGHMGRERDCLSDGLPLARLSLKALYGIPYQLIKNKVQGIYREMINDLQRYRPSKEFVSRSNRELDKQWKLV